MVAPAASTSTAATAAASAPLGGPAGFGPSSVLRFLPVRTRRRPDGRATGRRGRAAA
ncbi:hypothetical protein OG897_00975 [Streptomyces sp. NBC_00237]|uniref:hypothetical protein n=1 Tax=Streptomyces sp. NBC_00237 TaxID=2975687 RepID=UPI0022506496|nr:hypothetical protein [Streptomyces sp. NBC_00237]MCX5200039.1 hypothetical protein [Streptomyces sp. NBC_00237]